MTTRTPGAAPRPGGAGRSHPVASAARSLGRVTPARHRTAAAQLVPAQAHDDDQRLGDDPAAHLRLADAPVAERDRDLDDAGAEPRGPVGHLDLEHVPARADAVERHAVERRGAPRLEPAGEVVRA